MKNIQILISTTIAFMIAGLPFQTLGMERPDYADAHLFYTHCIQIKGPEDKGVVYWSGRSKTQSEAEKQYKLGNIFFYGRGVKIDFKIACYWLEKPAAQKHKDAIFLRSCLPSNLKLNYEDYESNVIEYYESCIILSRDKEKHILPSSSSTLLFEIPNSLQTTPMHTEQIKEKVPLIVKEASELEPSPLQRAEVSKSNSILDSLWDKLVTLNSILVGNSTAHSDTNTSPSPTLGKELQNQDSEQSPLSILNLSYDEIMKSYSANINESLDADQSYNLGLQFFKDEQTLPSCAYFIISAKKDNANAQFILGVFYYNGVITSSDRAAMARELFEPSAKQRHAGSLYCLNFFYRFGCSVKRNLKLADELLIEACNLNDYFEMNENHHGIPGPRYFEIVNWLQPLPMLTEHTKENESFSLKEASELEPSTLQGAEAPKSNVVLESLCDDLDIQNPILVGESTPHSDTNTFPSPTLGQVSYDEGMKAYRAQKHLTAEELFKGAAAQDHPEALFMLGILYHYGIGVSQSYTEAQKYYLKAVIQKHVFTQDTLDAFDAIVNFHSNKTAG